MEDFKVPLGYPPVTLYSFSVHPTPDASIVAKGPQTIYAVRSVVNPGESARIGNDGGFISDYWESNSYRLEYLSSLLDLPEDDIQFNKYFSMVWYGPAQYAQDITLLCSRMLNKYDRILALLQDAGLISRSEAETLESSILVNLTDFRKDKKIKLPEINLNRVIIKQ